jgi:hypothetical protein
MPTFARAILLYVTQEIEQAQLSWTEGQKQQAFRHLERAHILGQASTIQHARAHWHMLIWGLRSKAPGETLGQLIRMVSATTKTAIGSAP